MNRDKAERLGVSREQFEAGYTAKEEGILALKEKQLRYDMMKGGKSDLQDTLIRWDENR